MEKKNRTSKIIDLINNTTYKKLLNSLLSTVIIFIASFIIFFLITSEKDTTNLYYSKNIKTTFRKAIKSGANVSVIKQLFNSKEIYEKDFFGLLAIDVDSSYSSDKTLFYVLKDLEADYFLGNNSDTTYLKKLRSIIRTHQETNPFDKLASNQKYIFENVRQKLNENYHIIEEEMNRITDELDNKNQLVEKYLEKSNSSYIISIVALIFTIVLSTIQIFQNMSKSEKKS